MIYIIEFHVRYEGTETYYLVEHDEDYSTEELDRIMKNTMTSIGWNRKIVF